MESNNNPLVSGWLPYETCSQDTVRYLVLEGQVLPESWVRGRGEDKSVRLTANTLRFSRDCAAESMLDDRAGNCPGSGAQRATGARSYDSRFSTAREVRIVVSEIASFFYLISFVPPSPTAPSFGRPLSPVWDGRTSVFGVRRASSRVRLSDKDRVGWAVRIFCIEGKHGNGWHLAGDRRRHLN